jgi:hypothetical protein
MLNKQDRTEHLQGLNPQNTEKEYKHVLRGETLQIPPHEELL